MLQQVQRLCYLIVVLSLASRVRAEEPAAKLPIPNAEAKANATKLVRETFKADYAKKSSSEVSALARKLLQAGRETNDDPAAKFVLYWEARDLFLRATDPASALDAVNELAKSYPVDAAELKLGVLSESAKPSATPSANKAIAEAALKAAAASIEANRFDVALKFVALAKPAAKKASDKTLAARVDRTAKVITGLEKDFAQAAAALALLKEKPLDPEANLAAGRFLCFSKWDWQHGLPMLALGSDAKLKDLAARDLEIPQGATEQVKLADDWWDLAEGEQDSARTALRARAGQWYRQAEDGLSGLAKARASKRLASLPVSPPAAIHGVINLIKLLDLKQDVVKGNWRMERGALVSDASEGSRIEFPYLPPEEYDFRIEFARNEGVDSVTQICVGNGQQFAWQMDGWKGGSSVFHILKHRTEPDAKIGFTNGRRYVSTVKVRKDRVQAFLDDKLLTEHATTDYKECELWSGWGLRRNDTIGIGSWESPTTFYSAKLIEITGSGRPLR